MIPQLQLALRGRWVEVRFLSESTGGAAWWPAQAVEPPLSITEFAIIDRQVAGELARRQRQWREAQDARRRADIGGHAA